MYFFRLPPKDLQPCKPLFLLPVRGGIPDAFGGVEVFSEVIYKGILIHGNFFMRHGFPYFCTKNESYSQHNGTKVLI